MKSYTIPTAARSGQVVSSCTPSYTMSGSTSYTTSGATPYTVGSSYAPQFSNHVVTSQMGLAGTSSVSYGSAARPATLAAAVAPVTTYTTVPSSYTTVPSRATTVSSAAVPRTFNAGASVINNSARVMQAAPMGSMYTANAAGSIPTVTAAPSTYFSGAIAAPVIVETVAPGFVETFVAPVAVEVQAVSIPSAGEPLPEAPLILTYWPLFNKGCASLIALHVGGFSWQLGDAPGSKGTGDLWAEWLEMKPYTPWGTLPNLDIGGEYQIGSELAILQFLARKARDSEGGTPLQGANDFEFNVSQELLHQSEELHRKLIQKCPTIFDPDKSRDDFEVLWTATDRNTNNNDQGILVYLTQFEEFYGKVGGRGHFTSSGISIGEIKLYATLALLLLIDNGILTDYPGLLEFYMRWENDERVKVAGENGEPGTTVLDVALQNWGWQQFFIAPPPMQANAE